MKKLAIIIPIIISLIFFIVLAFYLFSIYSPKPFEYKVIEVIDGDTFVLNNGETVRLLCIDTPEKNKPGYENATLFLSNLVLMKEVRLENPDNSSFQKQDSYGRALYFVYVMNENREDVLVNRAIILNNFSDVYDFNYTGDECREVLGF